MGNGPQVKPSAQNHTLFLVGSEPTLAINLYLQVRDGSTPVISDSSCLALINPYFIKKED
jgi:spermidine/putrescine transport system permease protein